MSAILSAEHLNDFIGPGAACIKPVEVHKTNDTGRADIEIGRDGVAVEVSIDGRQTALEAAQISLSDCLACSGCITSAESVLVSMQSHEEVLKELEENKSTKTFVVSISHQARVSLAAAFDLSLGQVDAKLKHLFAEVLGFKYVVGLQVGRAIALEYGAREVMERRSQAGDGVKKGPLVSSNCPGWTCYVEKTHEHMIDYLSHVRSAQQITGVLLKHLVATHSGLDKGNIYHLSVMPCFDKKLEAARPEFGTEQGYRDVDCVITTKEIVQLLLDRGLAFNEMPEFAGSEQHLSPPSWPHDQQWASHDESSSGGYLDYIMNRIRQSHGQDTTVRVIAGRNSDIVEYEVTDSAGAVVARLAHYYGFRNIQNLVRKLDPRKSKAKRASSPLDYDYIEVMACPGGCLNGGGQIGRPEHETAKDWRARLEAKYSAGVEHIAIDPAQTDTWIRRCLGVASVSFQQERDLIYTAFQPVARQAWQDTSLSVGTKW